MANRGIGGESTVSEQAVRGAEYVKQFFEQAPNRTFTVERIIGQGSVRNARTQFLFLLSLPTTQRVLKVD